MRSASSCAAPPGAFSTSYHHEDEGEKLFEAACLEGIVSKSGPCKSWIKVRNPQSSAYMRISDGTFGWKMMFRKR
jgi:hypothetical protein